MFKYLVQVLVIFVGLVSTATTYAENSPVPEDPRKSISYWKPHIVDPKQDPQVAQVHEIFSTLLRTWDGPQIAPDLHVVESSAGPWAASLVDGNILMSRSAIDICLNFGREKAPHLLAFVLSHELAHQKSDDLWGQKFLRLAGNQTPENQRLMLQGLMLDKKVIRDIEQREAQADHDGLVIMASVGFDPFVVVDDQDFFTQWVEQIWSQSCDADMNKQHGVRKACLQAKARAARARAQLKHVAAQSALFDLGIQSFIAGQYERARYYFMRYGTEYPSRALYTNLGLSYLAEAIEIEYTLAEIEETALQFYYPILLEPHPLDNNGVFSASRGQQGVHPEQLKEKKRRLVEGAVQSFNQAIRLNPKHKINYLYLAMSYLVGDNTFMVRGVLQGQYLQRFDSEPLATMLLHMTSVKEGQLSEAEDELKKMIDLLPKATQDGGVLPSSLLNYALYYNYAGILRLNNKQEKSVAILKDLARHAKNQGDSLVFRYVLEQLSASAGVDEVRRLERPMCDALLGKKAPDHKGAESDMTDTWIDGEKFTVLSERMGRKYFLNSERVVLSVWQDTVVDAQIQGLRIGDLSKRPFSLFGLPSRHVHLIDGEYLAYDDRGLAIRVENEEVVGWFCYEKEFTRF